MTRSDDTCWSFFGRSSGKLGTLLDGIGIGIGIGIGHGAFMIQSHRSEDFRIQNPESRIIQTSEKMQMNGNNKAVDQNV